MGTTSAGPNGPALATASYDAYAVSKDDILYNAIRKMNDLLGNSFINNVMENNIIDPVNKDVIHSKVSFSAEPGGKTRMFAICDYWSQITLRPIHDLLMQVLKRNKCDGTYDQNLAFERICRESKGKKTYCFDLSGASHRIPLLLQKIRIAAMTSPDIAEQWSTIISDREFHSPKGKFRWAVGQPLGCLSSFPSFAGWHHDYIQHIGYRFGFKSFDEYQILGDDVVIWNSRVAEYYYTNIQILGIPINDSKSLLGTESYSQVEFVKRQAIQGIEISGLNNNLVGKDNIRNIAELIDNMFDRNLVTVPPVIFFGFQPKESPRVELISKLIKIRLGILRKEDIEVQIGNNIFSIGYDQIMQKRKEIRTSKLMKKLELLDKLLSGKTFKQYFKKFHIRVTDTQLGESGHMNPELLHPIVWVINHQGELLTDTLDNIFADEADVLQPIEYLPLPYRSMYFPKGQKPDKEYLSSLCIDIYDELLQELKT
jgi:hypothetical protein